MTKPISHHLRNGNNDLHRRRGSTGSPTGKTVVPIADIAARYKPGTVYEQEPDAQPVRTYRLTPLDEFKFDHLVNDDQRARLAYALERARAWMELRQQQAGLSFVITGPWGTGKTTIAENMMQAFKRELPQTAVFQQQYDGKVYEWTEEYPDREPILNGRLLEATALMRLVGDQMPLDTSFRGAEVIVIDDAGQEDFSTPTYTPKEEDVRPVRQSRYGRFFDYCYHERRKRPLHVIVTSNVPLTVDGRVNPAFIEIFGGKAFSRLFQMSQGFMCDLSGLPDYRPLMVRVK